MTGLGQFVRQVTLTVVGVSSLRRSSLALLLSILLLNLRGLLRASCPAAG